MSINFFMFWLFANLFFQASFWAISKRGGLLYFQLYQKIMIITISSPRVENQALKNKHKF